MEIPQILDRNGCSYKETQTGQIMVKECPFCPDTKEKMDNLWKLYISKENGLFFCHRCQSRGNIKKLAEKLEGRLFQEHRFQIVDQYLYQDEKGSTHVRVTRLEDKDGNKNFYQERLDAGIWHRGGAKKPLQPFRFVEWMHEASIVIVEGEKCVVAMRNIGLSATTFIGGCKGWKQSYVPYFQNKHVLLLPDQDEPGFQFMEQVASDLSQTVLSYRVVLLPGLRHKEDICDWIENGGTDTDFKTLCDNTPKNTLAHLQTEAINNEPIQRWSELKELPSIYASVKDIPPEIIPEVLRSWVTDIAERMQVPIICVAVLALTVAGSLIGRKARIYPKKEDDWYEVGNLWSMIIMPSGRLKSPIINSILKPLQELAEQAERAFAGSSKEAEVQKAITEAKTQAAKREIQKIASSSAQNRDQKLKLAQQELLKLQEDCEMATPSLKRYKIHDATVEKIGELLKTNTNGLLLVRDELSGWLSSLDRIGHEGDREFFLEAWNGKGSYDVDRIIRGSIRIPALCLSILGGIPPGKIETYVESAISGGAGNDGLLQRFGLMVHADFKKDWHLVDRAPDQEAYARVKRAFFNLDKLSASGPGTENSGLIFRFTTQAQELFYQWLTELERKIRIEESDSDTFISHISKYRKLVPALALQFFLLKILENHDRHEKIDTESLESAIAWAQHLESHARRVYSLALHPEIHAAKSLAQKIKQGKVTDGSRLRDIYRHQWSHLKSRANVDMAVVVLIECGWIVVEEIRPPTGAPCEVLRINPKLFQTNQKSNYLFDRTDTSLGETTVSFVNHVLGHGAIT